MNIETISLELYDKMSLEEKISFYKEIKPDNDFIPIIRQRKTKNMKNRGDKQPNGKLTYIDELKRTDKNITNLYYLCLCDCGNWHILVNRHFDDEGTISCGCHRKQHGYEMCKKLIGPNNAIDLTGKIFGELEVLEKTDKRISEKVIWKCKCINCGKEQEVQEVMLIKGARYFCEFCSQRKSKGEKIISSLLDINNIPYKKEHYFENCKFPNSNFYAYFDFYVNNSYLIEFDGEQHFKPICFGDMTTEKAQQVFEENKIRDNFKNQWCKENNIPLIRIPYTHLNKICFEDLKLETSTFLTFY